MMGEKAVLLKPFINDLKVRFPSYYRVVPIVDFKTALMNYFDKEEDFEDIVKRAAYACTNSTQKI